MSRKQLSLSTFVLLSLFQVGLTSPAVGQLIWVTTDPKDKAAITVFEVESAKLADLVVFVDINWKKALGNSGVWRFIGCEQKARNLKFGIEGHTYALPDFAPNEKNLDCRSIFKPFVYTYTAMEWMNLPYSRSDSDLIVRFVVDAKDAQLKLFRTDKVAEAGWIDSTKSKLIKVETKRKCIECKGKCTRVCPGLSCVNGVCSRCKGRGVSTTIGFNEDRCTSCYGSGRCSQCNPVRICGTCKIEVEKCPHSAAFRKLTPGQVECESCNEGFLKVSSTPKVSPLKRAKVPRP